MRTFRYIIITIILAAAFIIYLNRQNSKTGGRKPDVVPDNISGIDGISVINKADTTFFYRNDNGSWTSSGGMQANAGLILEALQYFEIVSPASGKLSDSIYLSLETNGTSIKLFKGNRLKKNIRLLYIQSAITGTYLTEGRRSKPWLVRLRNYMTDDAEGFILALNQKLSGSYFYGFSSGTINSIKISYPDKPGDSFLISPDSGIYRLYSLPGDPVPSGNVNIQRVTDYLSFWDDFSSVNAVKVNRTIILGPRFLTLEISATSGKTLQLDAYRNLQERGNGFDMASFSAIIDGADTLILNYSQMDPFFRKTGDFLKNQ